MTEHRTPGTDAPGPRPGRSHPAADAELARRITASLRSREAVATAAAADRIAARVLAAAEAPGRPARPLVRRAGQVAVAGVVTSTLAVVGAGAAAAANPYTRFAVVVEDAAQAVGVDWSAMPAGYTREQYEAFWGAGFTPEDVDVLASLWQTDTTATKARAGQLVLDGVALPVAPGSSADGPDDAALDAFWDAGYTYEDAERLAELWQVDTAESKARAGALLLEGGTLPLP